MIWLRWISSRSNWTTAAALADATSGASTVPRISPLARGKTTRQRRFIGPASFAGCLSWSGGMASRNPYSINMPLISVAEAKSRIGFEKRIRPAVSPETSDVD
jgi:hypothetical protein